MLARLGQQLANGLLPSGDHVLHFLIDSSRRGFAVVTPLRQLIAQKRLLLVRLKRHRSQTPHPPPGDHAPHETRGLNQVVLGARRDVAHGERFRLTAAEHHVDPRQQIGAAVVVALLDRPLFRGPERAPMRDDRDFSNRIGRSRQPGHNRVSSFVIRDDPPIVRRQHASARGTENDFDPCLLEILHRHVGPIATRGAQRGFVAEIGEIRSTQSGGRPSQSLEIDVGGHVQMTGVNPKDAFPAAPVGKRHDDLPIEAAWTQERRVEHVGAIGRGQENDLLVLGEAVHLHEELVERLLALVVCRADASPPPPSDGIQLVDEDDGGFDGLCPHEEIADAAGAHADKHLHELGPADAEEWNARLSGHGTSQQRLPCAGRSDEQDSTRKPGAELEILLRMTEDVHDLAEIRLRLVRARDIGKRRLRSILVVATRPMAAEAEHARLTARRLTTHPYDQQHHQDNRHSIGEQEGEPGRRGGRDIGHDVVRVEQRHERGVAHHARKCGTEG